MFFVHGYSQCQPKVRLTTRRALVGQSGTQAVRVLGHLGTKGTKRTQTHGHFIHLDTWALKALEALYLGDSLISVCFQWSISKILWWNSPVKAAEKYLLINEKELYFKKIKKIDVNFEQNTFN